MSDVEAPSEAYIVLKSGEKVVCLIEETATRKWLCVPVSDVRADEMAQAYVNIIPPGGEVGFVLQYEDAPDYIDGTDW